MFYGNGNPILPSHQIFSTYQILFLLYNFSLNDNIYIFFLKYCIHNKITFRVGFQIQTQVQIYSVNNFNFDFQIQTQLQIYLVIKGWWWWYYSFLEN